MFDWADLTAEEAERFMRTKEIQHIRRVVAGRVDGARLYDFGCGRGIKVKDYWDREKYLGLDTSEELVKLARRDNPGYFFMHWDLTRPMALSRAPFGVLKSVLEHQPSLEAAKTIYSNCVEVVDTLLVCWHTPPIYDATGIIRVQAELGEPIFQNHYKEGSFERDDLCVESERFDEFVLWTVTRR